MEIAGYFLATLIGLSLGLIGGGGSILTIPVLVYLFKINPLLATSYSLFVVGLTASYGSYRHYRMGNLILKPALIFAIPSLASLLFTRHFIIPRIPEHIFTVGSLAITKDLLIMLIFALLMMVVALSMIRKEAPPVQSMLQHPVRLGLMGLLVGFFTGFLGAGGGFVIIPALVFFAGLPMKKAVGTSLLIIALNSLLGFSGDLLAGVKVDYRLLFSLSAVAIAGVWLGTLLSQKIDGKKLKPAFGWFVLLMGTWILVREFLLAGHL